MEDKFNLQSKCKFSIAFENSSFPGYTTEKIIDAFAAQTIPIYWGDPEITRKGGFNPNAFIRINSIDDIEQAIEEIIRLDNNDEEYLEKMAQPVFIDANHLQKQDERLKQFLHNILTNPQPLRGKGQRKQEYERERFNQASKPKNPFIRLIKKLLYF